MRDVQRIQHIIDALRTSQLDALVCALPAYVLMTTGYWPVIGTSISVFNADGRQLVIVPQDELDLAQGGWADIRTYRPGSLHKLQSVAEAVTEPLTDVFHELAVQHGRIGFEHGPASEPASYAAMHLFGASIMTLIQTAAPSMTLVPADDILAALAAYKTPDEIDKIRRPCRIAESAFKHGASLLSDNRKETEVAANFRAPLSVVGTGYDGAKRADGFVFCMSGPNSALAYGAYARSRNRVINRGDLALVHCNSFADGYWTDITRTYCVGQPHDRILSMYEAVFAARSAALSAIAPGVLARDVDHSARDKLTRRGFGDQFKHPTGHGVGFASISANARPRIHPESEEILEPGMVFNLEPAIYIEHFGGIRHCDVVTVTESGAEVLTPFQATVDDLLITDEMLSQRRLRAA